MFSQSFIRSQFLKSVLFGDFSCNFQFNTTTNIKYENLKKKTWSQISSISQTAIKKSSNHLKFFWWKKVYSFKTYFFSRRISNFSFIDISLFLIRNTYSMSIIFTLFCIVFMSTLFMLHKRFGVNLISIVVWMSRILCLKQGRYLKLKRLQQGSKSKTI